MAQATAPFSDRKNNGAMPFVPYAIPRRFPSRRRRKIYLQSLNHTETPRVSWFLPLECSCPKRLRGDGQWLSRQENRIPKQDGLSLVSATLGHLDVLSKALDLARDVQQGFCHTYKFDLLAPKEVDLLARWAFLYTQLANNVLAELNACQKPRYHDAEWKYHSLTRPSILGPGFLTATPVAPTEVPPKLCDADIKFYYDYTDKSHMPEKEPCSHVNKCLYLNLIQTRRRKELKMCAVATASWGSLHAPLCAWTAVKADTPSQLGVRLVFHVISAVVNGTQLDRKAACKAGLAYLYGTSNVYVNLTESLYEEISKEGFGLSPKLYGKFNKLT